MRFVSSPSFSIVRAPTYTAKIGLLENGALLQERHIHRKTTDIDTDAFGTHWSFAYCPRATATVEIWREGGLIELRPPFGIYLPPFSLVQWHIGIGEVWFSAVNFDSEEPENAPNLAEAFSLTLPKMAHTQHEIEEALFLRTHGFPIGREYQPNSVAMRAKTEIDRTYSDYEVSISDIAARLNCPHAVMCRAFKKGFGLSPIKYRNKMRIWESMGKLVKKSEPVASIAQEVGFGELSQYNRMFRKNITVPPSKFREKVKKDQDTEF